MSYKLNDPVKKIFRCLHLQTECSKCVKIKVTEKLMMWKLWTLRQCKKLDLVLRSKSLRSKSGNKIFDIFTLRGYNVIKIVDNVNSRIDHVFWKFLYKLMNECCRIVCEIDKNRSRKFGQISNKFLFGSNTIIVLSTCSML